MDKYPVTRSIAQNAAAAKLGRSWCFEHETYPISLSESGLLVATVRHDHDHTDHDGFFTEKDPEYMRQLRFNAYGIRHIKVVAMTAQQIKKHLLDYFGDAPPQRTEGATILKWHEITMKARAYNAANILFEPTPSGGRVRLDIDGDAEEHFRFNDTEEYEKLVTYICRDIGNFNVTIGQRGRLSVDVDGVTSHCRISTFPIWNPGSGSRTKLVLRVLRSYELIPSLKALGMELDQVAQFKEMMAHPNACVIIGAPTGHGKSTTTYAGLLTLDIERKNIYALENPPEINVMPLGISQTEVLDSSQDHKGDSDSNTAKWTYYEALTECLRQDPKFVFVGECLEPNVTRTVLNSGVTGIPMATTLHAYDALAIIDCLRVRDISDIQIAKSVTALVSQRLVRHLCVHCCEKTAISDRLIGHAAMYGIVLLARTMIFRRSQSGCPECFQRATFGRSAVFEMIPVTAALRAAIRAGADDDLTMKSAREAGYVTMWERALSLVLRGVIDEEELYKRFVEPGAQVGRVPIKNHPFNQTIERDTLQAEGRGIMERRHDDAAAS